MLKYENKDIVGIYHGSDGVSYVYLGNTLVYSKEIPPQAPCFEVVDNITAYTANSYTDVYDLATSKWYKLNNLDQYEEYGLYGSGRTITYYVGKLTLDDGNEYEWNGTGWTDLGEVSGASITIKSPEYLERSANADGYMPLGEYFQENTTIDIDFQMTQAKGFCVIGDYFKTDNDDWRVFINYDNSTNNKVNYDFINTRVDWNSGDWSQRFNFEIGNYYIKNLNTGTNVITTSAKTGFTRPNQMYLFHLDTQSGSSIQQPNLDYGHVYSTKIKQNGVLVKDYIPWTDENGNYGFFDKVANEIHYSTGQMTGSSTVYDVTITGSTSYPKYYSEKTAPDNNLVFTDMAEAEAYQCPWVGMVATIGGLLYEYTDNGWSQLPFTITGVTKSSSNFTMKINGVDETAIIYADNGDNTYNYGVTYTSPITSIVCSGNSNIMTIDYSSATTTGWTSIGTNAFTDCSGLTSFVIPSSVTSIGNTVFYNCSGLTSVTIPSGLTSLGEGVFYNCKSLTSITIPSGITGLDNHLFEYCYSLTSVTIPSSVTHINTAAFRYCSGLTSLNIPSGVTSIGNQAFDHCTNLTNVTIPSGLTSLGTSAFCECHAAFTNGVVIPSAITSIPDSAFFGCNALSSVALHSGITNVSNQGFGYCNLTGALDIPDSVTTIGYYAFRTNNNNLTSVTIGSGVTSIGSYAFWQCRQLTGITVNATTPPTLGIDAFAVTNNCPIYVPAGSVSDYQTAWSDYASRIQAISN